MRGWGKYLEDRALHFWETNKIDFSGPFRTSFGPYLTYLDHIWHILFLFGPGPAPPTHLKLAGGYPCGAFFFFRKCFCFVFGNVIYVFSRQSEFLGQDFSPISLLFLHSNPIHFIFFSNPLHLQSTSTPLHFLFLSNSNYQNPDFFFVPIWGF